MRHTPAGPWPGRPQRPRSRTSSSHPTPTRSTPWTRRPGEPANDVHLPQRHRPVPFPPHMFTPLPFPACRNDQTMTDQTLMDRRPARHRIHPFQPELVTDRDRPPPLVRSPQLHNPGLDHRVHLMRTRQRPTGLIHQPRQPIIAIPTQPPMHALSRDAVPAEQPPLPAPRPARPPTPPHDAARPHPTPPTPLDRLPRITGIMGLPRFDGHLL